MSSHGDEMEKITSHMQASKDTPANDSHYVDVHIHIPKSGIKELNPKVIQPIAPVNSNSNSNEHTEKIHNLLNTILDGLAQAKDPYSFVNDVVTQSTEEEGALFLNEMYSRISSTTTPIEESVWIDLFNTLKSKPIRSNIRPNRFFRRNKRSLRAPISEIIKDSLFKAIYKKDSAEKKDSNLDAIIIDYLKLKPKL